MTRLELYTFEFHTGKLCKEKLRARPNNDTLAGILQHVDNFPGDKIDSYIGVLPNEYGGGGGGDICMQDIILLVKQDNVAGYKPVVIKNARPAIQQCMEYEEHVNDTVEYAILYYETWNAEQLLIRVNDAYRGKLRQYLEQKYNIVEDEIIFFD